MNRCIPHLLALSLLGLLLVGCETPVEPVPEASSAALFTNQAPPAALFSKQPASQSGIDIRVTIGFTANNSCNGDVITGTADLHIHQHIVSPGGAGFPGSLCHILDKTNGSGTGAPSGLTYKLRADGAFTGVNGILNINPANGAIVFQDDVRFVLDPIGAGSQGLKFTARILQGTTIAFNSGNVNTHLQFDPGTCRN